MVTQVNGVNGVNGHAKNGESSYGHEIPTLVRINPHVSGESQQNLHTRWHPDIPCVGTIKEGQAYRVECIDYSGGQVSNDDRIDDVIDLNHDSDHHLSGPFHIPSAAAGDVLEIDILNIRPFESQPWGYSVTSPGLGSLDSEEEETKVTKTIWDFYGMETSSRHVPNVAFQGTPHVGCIGTAPSPELLKTWNEREANMKRETGVSNVTEPTTSGAYVGQELEPALREKIYSEGARTSPGREHGGNIDISGLCSGSKVYLPVYVDGAKLSVGDLHFCQSEGEPTTAIEMSGIITLRVKVMKNGIPRLSIRAPIYETSPSHFRYPRQLVFTGLSTLPRTGVQTNQSGLVAYRNAAFSAIEHLRKFGFTREQAYVILSVAPIETRVVATANAPNFVISLGLPLDIFSMDIRPQALP